MHLFSGILIGISGLAFLHNPEPGFSPIGKWRGVFNVSDSVEIPFNFEIKGSGSSAKAYFLNADERFEAGNIRIANDSLYIPINAFDNELVFSIKDQQATAFPGILRKQDLSTAGIQVKAVKGNESRFESKAVAPEKDISGSYDILFTSSAGKQDKAVGLFKQEGTKLTATFLRITGDSRYLEGTVEGNKFQLSSFIGSSPVLYTGTITEDGKLTGIVQGTKGGQPFSGNFNEDAALPDAYSLTYLKDGYSTLDFSFPDVNGKLISPKDAKYKNKVLIVTITGSWCPNCIDEAAFLAPWYIENKKKGVEIISLHYERSKYPAYYTKAMNRFREKFNIQYDEVFAGIADKNEVAASLPALNNFLSFPTTILIDKSGKVAKIHTGFSGPATGKYFEEFKKEFNADVAKLLK